MVSFDATSLFINVPLRATVEYICDQLGEQEIETTIALEITKGSLLRRTMKVHFKFIGEIYKQIDGVLMGSLLTPISADIFLCKLKNDPLAQ